MKKLILLIPLIFYSCDKDNPAGSPGGLTSPFAGTWFMQLSGEGIGTTHELQVGLDGYYCDTIDTWLLGNSAGKFRVDAFINENGTLRDPHIIRIDDTLSGTFEGVFSNLYPSGTGSQGTWICGTENPNATWYARRIQNNQ